ISPWLAVYYAVFAAANLGAVVYCARRKRWAWMFVWLIAAIGFGLLAIMSAAGRPWELTAEAKHGIDAILSPASVMVGFLAFLVIVYLGRAFFVRPAAAWTGLNAAGLLLGASLADRHFAGVVGQADNVPILAMVFLLGFFTWLGMAQAVENDRRLARGLPPREAEFADKVFVWPNVVYLELIGLLIATAVLVVWSLALRAPLEGPANPALTPNPSKAPWYFVGLQELLVYFDPWFSGVTLPALIVLGLLAIPYIDVNPEGNGYYTIRRRRFAWLVYHFGFLQLWILLILIGTFFRGPSWGFFGLYEPRDPETLVALHNVKLSTWFWADVLGRDLPRAASDAGSLGRLVAIGLREIAGLVAMALYFVGLPIVLARTVLRTFYRRMGPSRYTIMVLLLLMMVLIPIKMLLHWSFHLSYLVSIPEFCLNI
ncbi:MAG: hypothetical protein JW719_07385, partial [Pirellulales bacterium]|nr:hypothetical protein [Pirellulales bacterium]